MTVRSERLVAVQRTTAGASGDHYVVPSGHRTIVKWVSYFGHNAGSSRVHLYIPGATNIYWHSSPALGDLVHADEETWVVLNAGEAIRSYVTPFSSGQQLDLVISGAELEL